LLPNRERKSFGILITYKRLMQHEVMKPVCFPIGSTFKSIEPEGHPVLVLDNPRILPKCSLKYPGVHLDESLIFKQHALAVVATGLKQLGSIKFLRAKT
jgi:hypothetical protein